MRETIDLRIPEEDASRYLDSSVGVRLGDRVRKVVVSTGDPLYARICEIDRKRRKRKSSFFLGWNFTRKYTPEEMETAKLFQLLIKRTFEPAGEECGTVYDESTACEFCGAGAEQASDLVLSERSLAKKGHLAIARTIADEIVVSDKFGELLESLKVTGAKLRTIRKKGKGRSALSGWRQLVQTKRVLSIVEPTVTGNGPTDDDPEGEYRCPLGHTIGLNLISELWISRREFEKYSPDIEFSRQCLGVRRGLIRPTPRLIVSSRVRDAILASGLKGFGFEVARLSEMADMARRPATASVQREQEWCADFERRIECEFLGE